MTDKTEIEDEKDSKGGKVEAPAPALTKDSASAVVSPSIDSDPAATAAPEATLIEFNDPALSDDEAVAKNLKDQAAA